MAGSSGPEASEGQKDSGKTAGSSGPEASEGQKKGPYGAGAPATAAAGSASSV